MKNVINFQISKFSRMVRLRICLIFCKFQPVAAYKGFAYNKSLYLALSRVFHEALRDVSYSRDTEH